MKFIRNSKVRKHFVYTQNMNDMNDRGSGYIICFDPAERNLGVAVLEDNNGRHGDFYEIDLHTFDKGVTHKVGSRDYGVLIYDMLRYFRPFILQAVGLGVEKQDIGQRDMVMIQGMIESGLREMVPHCPIYQIDARKYRDMWKTHSTSHDNRKKLSWETTLVSPNDKLVMMKKFHENGKTKSDAIEAMHMCYYLQAHHKKLKPIEMRKVPREFKMLVHSCVTHPPDPSHVPVLPPAKRKRAAIANKDDKKPTKSKKPKLF